MSIKPTCSSCLGAENCSKYCMLQAGKNLVNFINGIDVTETKIGEFRADGYNQKNSLIVSGHIMEFGANYTLILSDLSTVIDASGKFISQGDESPLSMLKAYIDSLNVDREAKEIAILTFKKVNSNKLLPVPIKTGSECEIISEDSNGKQAVSVGKVRLVKWVTDKKTGKLNCTLFCDIEKGSFDAKVAKIPIVDYGERIRLPQIEHTLKSAELDRDFIKMTPIGFIKPIEVFDGKYTVAIDGQHIYRVQEDRIFIAGSWSGNKLVLNKEMSDSLQKTKAYKKIHSVINYIERHKRFIVPYGLCEANIIDLTKAQEKQEEKKDEKHK